MNLVTLVLAFISFGLANEAPYCVTGMYGVICNYYTERDCIGAAKAIGGTCFVRFQEPNKSTPNGFVGLGNINKQMKSAQDAVTPFIEMNERQHRQDIDDQRFELERQNNYMEMKKRQEEILLLKQQQEYYKSLQEKNQPNILPQQNIPKKEFVTKTKEERIKEDAADRRLYWLSDSIAMTSDCVGEEAKSQVCKDFLNKYKSADNSPSQLMPKEKTQNESQLWVGILHPSDEKQIESQIKFKTIEDCKVWGQDKSATYRNTSYSFSFECQNGGEFYKKKIW